MQICKKRIRSLEANLEGIAEGSNVVVGVDIACLATGRLQQIGFTTEQVPGEVVLPAILGPSSRVNAEGRTVVHRNQPKETCFRQHEWTYFQWHGPDKVEVTEIVDVPYERYPRSTTPAPSVEVTLVQSESGKLLATMPAEIVRYGEPATLLHKINLALELFGSCEVMDASLRRIIEAPTIRLNWEVLPKGQMPWEQLKPCLDRVLRANKPNANAVIEHRHRIVNTYGPDFVAVGRGGFAGYVIFGFKHRNLFVLECSRQGNATYILGSDWALVSKLTKAEILCKDLHIGRLVHVKNWQQQLDSIMRGSN